MFSISITQIAGGVGGMAWLFRTHISKSWNEQRWPLGIPFALFTVACVVAVFDAFDVSYSYESLKKLLEILIFFWVVNCVRENRLQNSLSILLIVAATISCLYAYYQGWRDGINIMNRAEGTMSVYMTFAGLIMMTGVFALGRVLFRRPIELWLWPAIGVISSCLVFLTFTRQAWFGFLIGFIFLMLAWKKKWTLILIGMILAILLVYGSQIRLKVIDTTISDGVSTIDHIKWRINRMVSGQDETFLTRVTLWKGGWEIFKDHPLTGCGFQCVDLIHSQYPDPTGNIARLRGMHNNFIQLAVDTGIFGLSAWLGVWVCFFGLLYRRVKVIKSDQSAKSLICGSAAAAVAFLAGGCFESNLYDSEVAMVLYFIMALPFAGFKIAALTQEDEI